MKSQFIHYYFYLSKNKNPDNTIILHDIIVNGRKEVINEILKLTGINISDTNRTNWISNRRSKNSKLRNIFISKKENN